VRIKQIVIYYAKLDKFLPRNKLFVHFFSSFSVQMGKNRKMELQIRVIATSNAYRRKKMIKMGMLLTTGLDTTHLAT
jgi:hypothetical protein